MRVPVSVIIISFILAEIAGFMLVGKAIGVAATLGLALLGMLAGALLMRHVSLEALRRVRADLTTGRATARPLAEGAVLGLAALLILVPGFLSDLLGLALFIPAVRRTLWRSLQRRFEASQDPSARARDGRWRTIDLEQSEYGTASSPRIHRESPWRRDEGSGP
jgi:UPF0716 protein FxsA